VVDGQREAGGSTGYFILCGFCFGKLDRSWEGAKGIKQAKLSPVNEKKHRQNIPVFCEIVVLLFQVGLFLAAANLI